MAKNQYSDLVNESLFIEFKKAGTTEERKAEIVDKVFNIIRSVNTFPEGEVTFEEEVNNLRNLSTLDLEVAYKDGIIRANNSGQSLCYKFYPNIWKARKGRVGIRPISMYESFFIDKDLKRAVRANLTYDKDINGLRSWFRMSDVGYVMNFKPSVAKIIYDTNLNTNSKVLDYCSGYGGRLLGAWSANNVSEYVGIDPNTETFENALKFGEYLSVKYGSNCSINMYKECAENFTIDKYPQYKEYFDIAFSSPPYFDLEIYSNEETQSYIKFPKYDLWVKGFLRPTIHNCIDMLKPGGIFAVNISEDNNYGKAHNIKKIIQFICNEKGFNIYKEDKMELTVRAGNGDRERSDGKFEPIWYFKKGEL